MPDSQPEFDLFLSHATPDKAWVLTLAERLEALGLRVFVDSREILVGDNFVLRLSDALQRSRYMVLVLSNHTAGRPWVEQEWTSYVAEHGPRGRLLPVQIDAVQLPVILKATQTADATDRDAGRVADELFKVVGDPATLPADDARRLVLGRDLVFTIACDDQQLTVVRPDGTPRTMPLPWLADGAFATAFHEFTRLTRRPVTAISDRADLFRHARCLGGALFDMLFDEPDAERLMSLLTPDRARPVVQVRSNEDLLLALPWELLYREDQFLVREGRLDLVRTTPTNVAGETLLRKPTAPFRLVVNVSAPELENSHLSYEAESYRITLATAERCVMVPTELGTLDDLLETVFAQQPTGIHFSGHGLPGALLFENDEGGGDVVRVGDVIDRLRQRLPDDRRLPPFFYLASCHGNDPSLPDEDVDRDAGQNQPGAPGAAVQLHKAGVTEVVGYFGPIVDELSTRAEESVYEVIAAGLPTRDAIRFARHRLAEPFYRPDARHRPRQLRADADVATGGEIARAVAGAVPTADDVAADTHPFAWAQLVLYRRGPEWPLSVAVPAGSRQTSRQLERRFAGFGDRKVLQAGFIGRRLELHEIRRRIDQGDRVLVLQGLGGLGKSTLAQHVLPWLTDDESSVCTLWCQEVEGEANRAEALVGQLLAYCRGRFGLDWEGVVQQVDQVAGDDSAKRFVHFLHALVQNAPGLVVYFDNLESLLIGPENEDADAGQFGQWAEPPLEAIWRSAARMARDTRAFHLIASCRYRNDAFSTALLPVSPLPRDALFRLTEWFPALQRMTAATRARLVSRLDGHPRAVEFADDLVADALARWRDRHGPWSVSTPPTADEIAREWTELVEPHLPQAAKRLQDNLLLQALWDRVLDEPARRFLYRMTVLRRPVEWDLLALLGEPDEPESRVLATASRLRDTSLLEQLELSVRLSKDRVGSITHYALHPATECFIVWAHPHRPKYHLQAHRRLGEHLEATAAESPSIETDIEAGHHLFEAGEYDRAFVLLGSASNWLQNHGRVREGLRVLEPFLADAVQRQMRPILHGRLLGTVGISYHRFGEVRQAIGYYEQRIAIAREIGDRRGEGSALGNLGNAYADMGDVQKAIGYYEQVLVIHREIGHRRGAGNALGNLGFAYAVLGEVQKAIGYHEQALVIYREIGDRRGEGSALGNLGIAYKNLGEVQKATGYYEQRIVIAREIGDRQGEGNALGNLGRAYAGLGEVQKAIGYYEQALIISREIGYRQGEGNALGNLGLAYVYLGEVPKAIGYHEQALVISREIGNRRGEGSDLGYLGTAYARLGEVQKAIGYHEQALVISREIGDRRGEGNDLGNLGNAYARLGEVQKAIGYYEQALVIYRDIGDRGGEGNALGNLGLTYKDLGEVQKAKALLEQARAIGEQIQDPRIVRFCTNTLKDL